MSNALIASWQYLKGQDAVIVALDDLGGRAPMAAIEELVAKRYGSSRADTTNISLTRMGKDKEVQQVNKIYEITERGRGRIKRIRASRLYYCSKCKYERFTDDTVCVCCDRAFTLKQ